MRVVTLAKQLNNTRNGTRVLEKQEGKGSHCCSPDIIRRIRNSNMQEFPDGVVVGSSGIRQGKGVDTTIS